MRKPFFTAVLFLGLATLGFSQEKQEKERERATPEDRAQKKTEMLSKKLSLTKEQQDKVYAINLEQAKKMEEFRSAAEKERAERMEKRKLFFKENDNKIEKILTEEQKKTYLEHKKERQERFAHKKHRFHEWHEKRKDYKE